MSAYFVMYSMNTIHIALLIIMYNINFYIIIRKFITIID